MKKIALIMDGWERYFTYAWPSGILQKVRECHADVNLYIFNSSGSSSLDDNFTLGEYNIYRLPDLKDYDGIILDLVNIRYPRIREKVIELARAAGRPVISISSEIDGFYYVGIDNEKAIREIIEHLYEQHGCRKFWFVMSDLANYENQVRVRALKSFLQEKEIPYEEKDFYYESFAFKCGYNGFRKLRETHEELPDAVICANDNIAVGVCEAAAAAGYHVPEDFKVTGFDDFDKASFYQPYLTTVNHIREEVGYRSAELLMRIWAGEPVERFNYTTTRSIFSESCGCSHAREVDYRRNGKDQIIYGIETNEFNNQVLVLEYELMQCKTVQEMTPCIQRSFPFMKCDALYLVLDDHMNDFKRQNDFVDLSLLEDEEFHTEGYPEKMNVEFAYEDGVVLDSVGQQVNGLFPMFDYEKSSTDFLFMPLHFRDKTVGYFVIRNAIYLMEKQYLYQIINALTTALENLHKKEKAEYMNRLLADLYVKDAMTGLYNRMGLKNLAAKRFWEMKQKQENILIMFIDMDRLKYINDHFGHESGDFAIRTIAGTILHYCPNDAIPIRAGGDEFLVVLPYMEEKAVKELAENIRGEIGDVAERMDLPYSLSVSIGCICTDMTTDQTLDDYIREADRIMYDEKMKKKAGRGR